MDIGPFELEGPEGPEGEGLRDLGHGVYEAVLSPEKRGLDEADTEPPLEDTVVMLQGDGLIGECEDLDGAFEACMRLSLERVGVESPEILIVAYATVPELNGMLEPYGIYVWYPESADPDLLLESVELGEPTVCFVSQELMAGPVHPSLPGLCDACPVCVRGFDFSDPFSTAVIVDDPTGKPTVRLVRLSDFMRGWNATGNSTLIMRRRS